MRGRRKAPPLGVAAQGAQSAFDAAADARVERQLLLVEEARRDERVVREWGGRFVAWAATGVGVAPPAEAVEAFARVAVAAPELARFVRAAEVRMAISAGRPTVISQSVAAAYGCQRQYFQRLFGRTIPADVAHQLITEG